MSTIIPTGATRYVVAAAFVVLALEEYRSGN